MISEMAERAFSAADVLVKFRRRQLPDIALCRHQYHVEFIDKFRSGQNTAGRGLNV